MSIRLNESIASFCLFFSFYLSEGFIHLENIVGEAVIRLMANPNMTDCDGGLEHNISVAMRQLPYPQYTVDFFLITAVSILPFLIVLAFIYSAGTFTKVCVYCYSSANKLGFVHCRSWFWRRRLVSESQCWWWDWSSGCCGPPGSSNSFSSSLSPVSLSPFSSR